MSPGSQSPPSCLTCPKQRFRNKKIKSRTEKRETLREASRQKVSGAFGRRDAVPVSVFVSESLLTDICFVIFVPFWVGCVPLGRIRGKQRGADCCHCRLTARTVINNCLFLALFAMNYILSALQIYRNTCTHTRKDID